MTDRIEISLCPDIRQVAAADWDALTSPDDPFTTHAFLRVLEESGSVGAEAGWQPAHVLTRKAGRLVGACAAYVKDNSYGEYIFDWGWARAAQENGISYYPKVVSAVPFTPAQGHRLLLDPARIDLTVARQAAWQGLRALADAARCSSIHVLFCQEDEQAALSSCGMIPRLTHQFHWTNQGYTDFEHWLSTFRSKERKEAHRERRRLEQLGATLRILRGPELEERHWHALERFYRSTTGRKWGSAYLTPAFFQLARTELSHLAIGILVEAEGRYVAGALLFQRGAHLYGRYWGCEPEYESLHFEVCYHRPIELCIEAGWTRFEAGAQGMHKLKRGLMPSITRSAHWIRHPGLHRAILEATQREARLTEAEIRQLSAHGPFRRGPEGG